MKVLFIDDDSMMLRMASFIMKKGGHQAVTAESGAEGIELIKENAPDVVFIDVEMPGMNGFETLEALNAEGALSGTRVYMMSGTVTGDVESQAKSLGAAGVIDKPLNAAEVLGAVNG